MLLVGLQLFVLTPLSATHVVPSVVQILLALAIVGAVLIVVWPSRGAIAAVFVATAVELAAVVLRVVHPSRYTQVLDFLSALIFLVAITTVLTIAVFGPGRVTVHRIQGAIAVYLNVALVFALAFRLIDALDLNAFGIHFAGRHHGLMDFAYFSFETLTTSGYGDIVPIDPFARSLASLESVIGQLFPATILARLVTLELETRRQRFD